MGDGASADDMRSVETINAKIKTDPNYENLVKDAKDLSLIHISEPTRLLSISYAVFCLKKSQDLIM